ncbi:DNA internalization-related competence protein ComEC/Rec2 [Lysinibacillus sp. Bpr_S20]|uniref:DNA internalization-related competence protein ComEC/Rec2 n=1 Tax=Lysinibacillus sp. Bpr_S20 TaxID=2933964 RepID=UPI002013949B|nr:DNA internalization-related competence protein ComEC/Rec2 [Lysinibacillus sp. Bpr_S20]MCL1701389.1 DNA internalization-related competence protein ComEC/Rec2 [Lysinibacillus sp. Bpr_S20]
MKGETRVISAFVIVVGCLSYFFIVTFHLTESPPLPSTFQITWSNEYKINGQKLRGFVKTETGEKLYVVYTFSSEEEKSFYENTSLTGRVYLVHGELIAPLPPAHAYAFSMEEYLISKGANGIFEVSSLTFKEEKRSIGSFLAKQRHYMKKHIETTFPEILVAEAQALLIGSQDQVDHELQRAYQKLGITHLFAISGLHVALVSWLFFEGLLRIGVRKEMATLVLLIILPIYGVIAGGAPSVWRAVSVVELIMLMRYAKWQISIDDALAISFICFVLLEPGVIFQIGFQLSYLATVSLVYSGVILTLSSNWLIRSFLITFVCQLLVYPLLLHHFYEISISSFLANIIFVPLFSFVILPLNIALFVLTIISMPVAKALFDIYEPCRVWLTKFILYLQEIPFQLWSPGKPAIWLICVALISVLVGFYFIEIKHYGKFLVVVFLPALCIHLSPMLFNETKLTFLNVGQGDCTVIELPFRRAVYVVDSGGVLRFGQEVWKASDSPYEVGRQVVVPFLKGKGIRDIDVFIATHADADHVEGAEEILQEINMHEIHLTPGSMDKPVMRDLLMEAKKKKVPVKEKMQGTAWRLGKTSFQYLWPRDTLYEGNNDSIVLYIQQESFRALLTGDLEAHGEQELIDLYNKQLADITLLKAGHHGSKTSSSEPFVELLRPELTIFSAGLNNRYHHPHEEIVERFTSRNLWTLTTGIVGTIEVKIRGDSWSVQKEKDLVQ